MLDRFTLLTLSFSLILHNVCSWEVSVPLNHTFNEDDTVNVTCMVYGNQRFEMEAKLIMNGKPVCQVYQGSQGSNVCKWHHDDNKFTFTLMNPEALYKNEFLCEISKIKPYPIITKRGPKTKLFRGCSSTWVSPTSDCSCSNQTHDEHTQDRPSLEDMYIRLICGLIIVVMVLCLYSIIITVFYIRLKATPEPSDTLTYVPMQRNINGVIQTTQNTWTCVKCRNEKDPTET